MGELGRGLVDSEARIQERQDEIARLRPPRRSDRVEQPEELRELESLRLSRAELLRQLALTCHAGRRGQVEAALAEVDRRAAGLRERLAP
jgi:hypothetical protein